MGFGSAFTAFFEIIIQAFYLEVMGHLLIVASIILIALSVMTALGFSKKPRDDHTKDTPQKDSDIR